MKKVLFIAIIIMMSVHAFSTEIAGGNVNGIWDLAGSPYNINGNITIINTDALVIDAEVVVNFTGYYTFTVVGQLDINGTSGNEATITAADNVVGWAGLRFSNSAETSAINYCNIEYGRATGVSPLSRGGGIYAIGTDELTLDNVSITNCSATGTGGGMYLENSDITISNSTISDNVAAGGAGIVLAASSDITMSYTIIKDNEANYDGGGIYVSNSNPNISFTQITGNSTEWNGGGICAFNNSNVNLSKVTIASNNANLGGSGIANQYNSVYTIMNSILYGNAYNNIDNQNSCSINVDYSDIQFASNYGFIGEECIDENPLFDANYNLTWANIPTPDDTKSPCIDNGNPDHAYNDLDGTIADMGAYYFVQTGIKGIITLDGGSGEITEVVVTGIDTTDPTIIYTSSPDSDGNYLLDVVPGEYNVTATLDGYGGPTATITVTDAIVVQDFTLVPPPTGRITGQVTATGIGDILQAEIKAGNVTVNPYYVEDEYGNRTYHYQLDIAPGIYDVTANLSGYQESLVEDVPVNPSDVTPDIDFHLVVLQYVSSAEGIVELVTGAIVDPNSITISCGTVSTHPNLDGTFLLENVPAGVQTITASKDGYATVSIPNITITVDIITPDVNFELIDWDIIDGTVFTTTFYATTTYDGDFIYGNNRNTQFGIFDNLGNCHGVAIWVSGNHPHWCNTFDLNGFWYLSIVSNDNSGTEELSFRLYDAENDVVENCSESFFFPTDPSNDYSMNLTIPSPIETQTFDIIENWNWISTNLNPANSLVDDVFDVFEASSVIFQDLQIKNQGSTYTYNPGDSWVGDLPNIDNATGYKFHSPVDNPAFEIHGEKINPIINSIAIVNGYDEENHNNGYNWISYLPYQELDLETALQSLSIPDTSIIKSQTQSAVYYGGWIGDLTTLEPGTGYLFKWHEMVDAEEIPLLTYPIINESREISTTISETTTWDLVTGNKNNMIVMAKTNVADNISMGLFDADGNCHSIGKNLGDFWYFTVTEANSNLTFRSLDTISRVNRNSLNTISFQANQVLGNPEKPIEIHFRDEDVSTNEISFLEQNSPNPFNPTTTIRFQLATEAETTLEIFNTKGQKVKTLVNNKLDAGNHSAIWNGKDDSNNEVVSGVYFYRLISKNYNQTYKMLLIK